MPSALQVMAILQGGPQYGGWFFPNGALGWNIRAFPPPPQPPRTVSVSSQARGVQLVSNSKGPIWILEPCVGGSQQPRSVLSPTLGIFTIYTPLKH